MMPDTHSFDFVARPADHVVLFVSCTSGRTPGLTHMREAPSAGRGGARRVARGVATGVWANMCDSGDHGPDAACRRGEVTFLSPTACRLPPCVMSGGRRLVITQSPPRPKGPLALYVHTQETVDHTLLRVAVCSTTVEADSVCM